MRTFHGLTHEEVNKKLKEFGPNELREAHKTSVLTILFRQIKKNFILYLLTITAIASFLLGKDITGFVILAVIAIVIITGFVQEYKAEKAIGALRKMITPVSFVVRDGKQQEIPSSGIVPGDIMILRTGEKVPADCVVLEGSNLKTNESILTGESEDISKTAAKSATDYTDENLIFMGSFVVHGRSTAQVLATGMNTKFGKIAGLISSAEKKLPLQDKVNRISKYMAIVGLAAAGVTGVVLLLRADAVTFEVIVNILIIVIALSVSSFPEGFPVVLTTTLAAGMNRMAKQNAVINRMSIIETLGETSVICSDKTGTLTRGEMTVQQAFIGGKMLEITGVGYEAVGDFLMSGTKLTGKQSHLEQLLTCAVICNDSNIERTEEAELYRVIGSATEGALLVLAAKRGMFKENFPNPRIEEVPFDSQRKMMSVLYNNGKEKIVYAKGAPEVILRKCTHILSGKGVIPFSDAEKKAVLAANSTLTSEAFRSLALAYKSNKTDTYKEDRFVFLGLVGMEDPPREEVTEAIALCKQSGIKVKMITGDNKETAIAIAHEIGIDGDVVTGDELDALPDDALEKVVMTIAIFARVKPEDKLRIVKALKANNEVVTMTGDGVNDAPALKEAHIGVAMGINGTDVSRSVADITLKDDNFATIVAAVKEGRTIFTNIRKFVTYQLSCNFSDIYIVFIAMLVAPTLNWSVPVITALQILFINIVTDNMPAITLGFNPSSKDIMRDRPRKNAEILTQEFIHLILLNGTVMGIISFGVSFLSFNVIAFSEGVAQTTILLSIILMQIANAYNFRSFRYSVFTRSPFVNRNLLIASCLSILATVIIIYTPLNKTFETTPLGIESWVIALMAAFLITAFMDLFKLVNNKTRFFLQHVH
jgi:P-type Ca2+ transporter type 2C